MKKDAPTVGTPNARNKELPTTTADGRPLVGAIGRYADPTYITEMIRHRYPFLLVDRIVEATSDGIVAQKNVSWNEPFFQGHFPGQPIMPGVLILEGMAQAGCVFIGNRDGRSRLILLASIDGAKFRRPVVPGDVLMYHIQLLQERMRIGRMAGRAIVNGEVVCEAEIKFAYGD
jgi:beta-hydroxyacyl-ACP dehydratase FabZ